jgi:hypothetical protein
MRSGAPRPVSSGSARRPIFPRSGPAARSRCGKASRRTGRFSPWNARGAESFTFRILEEIDLEQLPYGRERALKERAAHWREVLGASAI